MLAESPFVMGLMSMRNLDLSGMKMTLLPQWFGELTSLTELHLSSCEKLISLPEGIGDIKALTELDLGSCQKLTSLPDRFGECKSLKKLEMLGCPAGGSMPGALKAQLKNQGCSGRGW